MQTEKKRIAVIGASRGIGSAVARYFVHKGDYVMSISRNQPIAGKWVRADISTSEGIDLVAESIGESVLDALLFMGGVWEEGAFTEKYNFIQSSDRETRYVIAVNTIAPIELTKKLANNLVKSHNPRLYLLAHYLD